MRGGDFFQKCAGNAHCDALPCTVRGAGRGAQLVRFIGSVLAFAAAGWMRRDGTPPPFVVGKERRAVEGEREGGRERERQSTGVSVIVEEALVEQ